MVAEVSFGKGVWGSWNWNSGFRAPTSVQRGIALLREIDYFLKEAEIAEQEGRTEATEHWLQMAIAAEAKAKARTPAAA